MATRSFRRTTPSANGHAGRSRTAAGTNGRSPHRRRAGRGVPAPNGVKLLPSFHLAAEREALLQTGLGFRADRLAVHYSGGGVRLALSLRGVPLLEGVWDFSIAVNGRTLEPLGDWDAVCWNADEDADYLELQRHLADGGRVDRQLLLSRTGHLAFLADSVILPHSAEIAYRACCPLAEGVRIQPEAATRTLRVRAIDLAGRIYPLALPSSRAHSTPHEARAEARRVELIQRAAGSALYAPLVVDWSPKRRTQSARWQQLTVSEGPRVLPADVAAGYRLEVGRDQWLVYHSLQNHGEARAVLGHHTWNETVIGSFHRDGSVSPLILVEQALPADDAKPR